MKKQLGCLSVSGIITVIVTLIVVIGFILISGGSIFSPGPLNGQVGNETSGGVSSHADLSKECGACHAPPWSRETMTNRCHICHTGIEVELQTSTSLHGAMLAESSLPCQECHTDHNGVDAPMTIIDTQHFPHTEATGYALLAHQEMSNGQTLACDECHQADLGQFEVHTCDTCHQDIDLAFAQTHMAAFGQDCLACHDGVDTYGAAFDHNQTDFPLAGEHASEDCIGCHQDMYTLVDLQATEQTCYACHQDDDEHQGQFGQNCAVCHIATDWDEATFDHDLTNFPLLGVHNEVEECTACHMNEHFKDTPQTCYACHQKDDIHLGQFGQDCAECHTAVTWEEATFNHALTNFPLTNAHERVECESCHIDNVFQNTARECVACHIDPTTHLGLFGTVCVDCHTTKAWTPATYNLPHTFPYDHERRNRSWECQDCHPASFFTYSCYEGCHEHTLAKVEREHLEEGVRDYQNCMECHPTGREHEGKGGSRGGSRGDD